MDHNLEHPLIKAYHGSGTQIERFRYEFTNAGNDQLGSGFYFTSEKSQAAQYALRRTKPNTQQLDRVDAPSIMHVQLSINNPMTPDTKAMCLSRATVRKILERAPNLDETLENFGDMAFEGKEHVLGLAVSAYTAKPNSKSTLLASLFRLANDFYPKNIAQFNQAIFDVLGYDGVVQKFKDGTTNYVAFFPGQIEITAVEAVIDGQVSEDHPVEGTDAAGEPSTPTDSNSA